MSPREYFSTIRKLASNVLWAEEQPSSAAREPVYREPDYSEPAGPEPPPTIEIREIAIAGSDLRYYPPFGPEDSIFDAWLKFQAFTSDYPITVRVTPWGDAAPILVSSFLPNGVVHSTHEMFFLDLANLLRANGGPGVWRGVRQLSCFG